MSDDIVKRLRDDYVRQDITSWNLLPEAADEIERLREENRKLSADRDDWQTLAEKWRML